jgi:hypothetical protein
VEVIVPLISSSVTGPLGATHLPRLWLKILLHALGRLPEGYRHGQGGFDGMTLEGLGIDAGAFVAFIERERPSYLACEAWVREHATKLDAASIAAHNERILTRDKPVDAAAEARKYIGLPDDSITRSIPLNDLDDWTTLHAMLTTRDDATAP